MNPPTCYACLVLAVGVALLNRGGEAVDSRAPIKLEVMGADAGSDSSQSMELVLDGNDMLGYGDATAAAQFCESHFEGPDQRSECTSTLIAQIEQLRTNNLAAEAGAFYSRQTISTLSGWVQAHTTPEGGIMISDQRRRMYPEVTGYYLPTLLDIGAYDEAATAVDALISVQREDGAFGLGANVFVFDTAMVVRGLVHMVRSGRSGKTSSIDRVRDSLRAACSWLAAPEQRPASNGGRWTVPGNDMWSLPEKRGRVPEGIHLLGIVPLRMCGEVLGVQHFVDVSHQLQGLYLRDEQLLREMITFERRYQLTHFFAYIQEALQELGEDALVRLGMGSVQRYQRSDGSVPAYFDAEWSCSTGLAQLAMVWYKMGDVKSLRRADAALAYLLREMQDPASGGFLGSRGVGAAYFPQQQISWAVKYTLDALQALISAHFTRTVDRYPTAVDAHDGRLVALNHLLPEHTTVSDGVFDVLEVGCGKGRFAASFGENLPRNLSTRIVGTDISLGMLQFARRRIDAVAQAPATNLPFPPASFDAVFSVETLEHVLRVNATIAEMSRVLAPRGKLCIVDKTSDDPQRRHQNWQLESWERWFGGSELAGVLKFAGGLSDITVRPVGYDRVGGAGDGLFLAWCGSKMPVPT